MNMLTFYDLDYTLNVFKHEVNNKEESNDKELCKVNSREAGN